MKKVISFIAGLFIFIFCLSFNSYALDIAVIVNASGPLVNAAKSDVKDIYLGEKGFEHGVKLAPYLYAEGNLKDTFLKETLRMTPKEYRLHWIRRTFLEGIPVPKSFDHPDDIISTVRNNKGGIGFVPREMLKDLTDIKIIMVIKK